MQYTGKIYHGKEVKKPKQAAECNNTVNYKEWTVKKNKEYNRVMNNKSITDITGGNNEDIKKYDRQAAAAYAKKWAFGRNPKYYNFDRLGGDCTNFASQCIFAGAGEMNYTPTFGWYYKDLNDRAPAWTGVEYLYNFLTKNDGKGPFGEETKLSHLEPGDIVQLGRATGDYYHTPVVVAIKNGKIYVAAHTYDAYMRPLSSYNFARIRGVHILGVRK